MANCTKADKSRPFVATKVRFQELEEPRPLKRARVVEHEGRKEGVGIHRPAQQKLASTGLSKTVQELIRSYVPASHEKKAFYCRCCQYEGSSEEDFFSHRESPVHHAAVELERKASFCRLCRKQFTSPEQIKEHLKGKAHKQNLELMSRNNQSRTAAGVKLDRI